MWKAQPLKTGSWQPVLTVLNQLFDNSLIHADTVRIWRIVLRLVCVVIPLARLYPSVLLSALILPQSPAGKGQNKPEMDHSWETAARIQSGSVRLTLT